MVEVLSAVTPPKMAQPGYVAVSFKKINNGKSFIHAVHFRVPGSSKDIREEYKNT